MAGTGTRAHPPHIHLKSGRRGKVEEMEESGRPVGGHQERHVEATEGVCEGARAV